MTNNFLCLFSIKIWELLGTLCSTGPFILAGMHFHCQKSMGTEFPYVPAEIKHKMHKTKQSIYKTTELQNRIQTQSLCCSLFYCWTSETLLLVHMCSTHRQLFKHASDVQNCPMT